jgi:hypothetical protein
MVSPASAPKAAPTDLSAITVSSATDPTWPTRWCAAVRNRLPPDRVRWPSVAWHFTPVKMDANENGRRSPGQSPGIVLPPVYLFMAYR